MRTKKDILQPSSSSACKELQLCHTMHTKSLLQLCHELDTKSYCYVMQCILRATAMSHNAYKEQQLSHNKMKRATAVSHNAHKELITAMSQIGYKELLLCHAMHAKSYSYVTECIQRATAVTQYNIKSYICVTQCTQRAYYSYVTNWIQRATAMSCNAC